MISLIIPVYNVESYLRESLDSAIGQTLEDIEIICVNDGSTDASGVILAEYAARDSRLRVVERTNGGLSAARNTGLDQAVGKYVAFLDSDDRFAPDLCEKAVRAAEKSRAEMTTFYFTLFGEPDEWTGPEPPARCRTLRTPEEKIELFCDKGAYVWATLWRRDFLNEHSFRFAEGLCYEDGPFTFPAALCAEQVELMNERLYFYRIRNDSITGSLRYQNALDMTASNRLTLRLCRRASLSDAAADRLLCKMASDLYYMFYKRVLFAPARFRRKYLRAVRRFVRRKELKIICRRRDLCSRLMRHFFLAYCGRFIGPFYRFVLWREQVGKNNF